MYVRAAASFRCSGSNSNEDFDVDLDADRLTDQTD